MPLPWFRRKKAGGEQAPSQAATPAVAEREPLTVERPAATPAPAQDGQAQDGQPTPKKRRRGSRGGRGRRKPAVAGAPTGDKPERPEQQAEKAEQTEKAERPARTPRPPRTAATAEPKAAEPKPERKRTRDSSRARPARRPIQRRAPLPKAKRELLVSVDAGEKRAAMLEDDIVAEVYLERPEKRSIAGNVYLGTVDNVLPGMEAAFVEIGLEKNGFLYVDEIVGPELEGRKGARKITDLIQRGQTILVQAVKDPMKTKGARLTTEISLPGRFVVFVPHGDGLGVSRRLDDDERTRLKAILKEISPENGGVIVRTAAEGASAEDIARDLDFLRLLWETIESRAKKAKAPALIYQEAELPLRLTRDLFTGEFERLLVDHDLTHKRIVGYLKKTSPHMVERVTRYKDKAPLMEAFGVEQEIQSTLNRRVDLPSGGYLIFDYAEAFTVIDVNTGRFVGSRSKTSGGRLEDTITKNNLEAVKEVVRQLRLRDIGGIIVIDFIDMANPKNRAQVEEALRVELERDRTKTYVVEISPLGLVEMTRQNVTDGPREVMTRKCPTCSGDGIVVSERTSAVELERRLRALVTPGSRVKAYKIELSAKVAALLVGPGGSRLSEIEELTKRRFFLVGVEGVHLDHFRVLDQGTVEKLAPEAPVEVGQELEVKLGEVGLHDSSAGVGKVKGFEIYVGDAAKLVGKKVRVRVNALMEGVAFAELADTGEEADAPLTAEGEAEKPTRAPRRGAAAKQAGSAVADEEAEDAVAEEDEDDEAEAVEAPTRPARRRPAAKKPGAEATPAASEAAAEEERAEPKGPARSRRAKKPVAAETEGAESADAEVGTAEATGEAEAEATPKKRTRRGTRGGRGRARKPGESADVATEASAEVAAPEEEPTGAEPPPARPARRPAAGPVIHLPDRELETDDGTESSDNGAATAATKRTRRGSRGGRNRKRKPVEAGAATAVVEADAPTATIELEAPTATVEADAPADDPSPAWPSANGDEDWEYTPMSEWGDTR